MDTVIYMLWNYSILLNEKQNETLTKYEALGSLFTNH